MISSELTEATVQESDLSYDSKLLMHMRSAVAELNRAMKAAGKNQKVRRLLGEARTATEKAIQVSGIKE